MNKFTLSLFLICTTFFLYGQTSDIQKTKLLDSLFQELSTNKMSMGSISIYKDGRPFYAKTYGISNIKSNIEIPSTEKTLYRVGSVSKVFTAFIIMKMVEEHKLALNQTITSFFPALKNADNTTIQQLLAHKSPLPVFVRVDDLEKLRKAKNETQLIAAANKLEANTDTSKIKYNNLNYILLGLIAEKTLGKPYNSILNTYLAPLNDPKVYGTYKLLDATKNEANSFHLKNDKWIEDYEIIESPVSDGSGFLLADARTLNEFMIALFSQKLLKQESVDAMLPQKDRFGFGLMKANFNKHKGYGHSGRIEGFTTAAGYFPEEKISIAFVQNGTVYPLNDILIQVNNILFDEPVEMPELKKIPISHEQEEKLMGTYENEEEGYKVIVDRNKGELRLRVAKGNGLLNKMILKVFPLRANRLFSPFQGILFDFIDPDKETYSTCEMRINGAKLTLKKN